ncbi:hypothetical protein ACJJTC_004226 [Scirpophaga incertulas]
MLRKCRNANIRPTLSPKCNAHQHSRCAYDRKRAICARFYAAREHAYRLLHMPDRRLLLTIGENCLRVRMCDEVTKHLGKYSLSVTTTMLLKLLSVVLALGIFSPASGMLLLSCLWVKEALPTKEGPSHFGLLCFSLISLDNHLPFGPIMVMGLIMSFNGIAL